MAIKRTFPNAIFASATGHKVYVSHAEDTDVTIIDSLTDEVIKTLPIAITGGTGLNFAFAGHKNSNFVYLSSTVIGSSKDRIFAIDINQDVAYPYGTAAELSFDGFHNPFAVHPDGHTQATFGFYGYLSYFEGNEVGKTRNSIVLQDTVSGVYLDSNVLICTIRPFGPYRSGVQIIHSKEGTSTLVELPFVGDLAFSGDTKAYVGEESTVRPIDLATGSALPAIRMGAGVANIISGYINQSL